MCLPYIVTPSWVEDNSDSGMVLVDVRPPPLYQANHIVGAVNFPAFYFAPAGAPPSISDLARRLGSLGIKTDTPVVAYDDGASPSAAVLFWLLRYLRHRDVAVLNGGFARWRRQGHDGSVEPCAPSAVEYKAPATDSRLLGTYEDVQKASRSGDELILDVRAPAEYHGLQSTAARNGHVPGALNLEWSSALELSPEGIVQFKPDSELESMMESAGIARDRRIIVYCQSGNRSSHAFLVLTSLGYSHVSNYVGGWQEWGNRPDTRIERE